MTASEHPSLDGWGHLTAQQKRARLLAVANELFAREGVGFPIPALADAAGVGVGTVYRLFGSKDDILTELVVDRVHRFAALYRAALDQPDPVAALRGVASAVQSQLSDDKVATISFDVALDDPRVIEARADAAAVLTELIERSKVAGGLRDDADIMDLRMMFRAAREAERLVSGGGARLVEVVMDGLLPVSDR